jgi:hypothetical protein
LGKTSCREELGVGHGVNPARLHYPIPGRVVAGLSLGLQLGLGRVRVRFGGLRQNPYPRAVGLARLG